MSANETDSNNALRVFVIDDDPINLGIIDELLTDEGYAVTTESDSLAAWDALQSSTPPCDIVLLDWFMPNLDGLELLKRIKSTPALKQIPVILQTGNTDKARVVEGIGAGAFYYLTKPLDAGELTAIVRAAGEDYSTHVNLQQELQRERHFLLKMHRGVFQVKTLLETQELGVSLANACAEPDKAIVGFNELLTNAVEHGNLGITYEEKSRLKQTDTWQEEINRRLQMQPYRDRCVEVDFRREANIVVVTITDQGEGFEWQKYLDFDPARAFDSHGRGIALTRLLSFSSIEYNDCGNSVTVRTAASV